MIGKTSLQKGHVVLSENIQKISNWKVAPMLNTSYYESFILCF